ncbi:helix-turn-helix transcriptional regulator [Streptomyces chilikensis]|uniref:helix-turn-helix transcriptional regulator n=2 Tax=Streptomyces TaxID=1883 RepID=UPI000B30BC1F|nr:helix-turn-helix transcriptional regulator [Streptomyces chilikensis]
MTLGGGDLGHTDTTGTHPHGMEDLCADGRRLYADSLRLGRIRRSEAETAPCLLEFALLQPDPDDSAWLRPVPPMTALSQRLLPLERDIRQRREQAVQLAQAFEPFLSIATHSRPTTHAITVLEGVERINEAIRLAQSNCRSEILSVQPGGGRSEPALTTSFRLAQEAPRGIVARVLYQHTARHSPGTLNYARMMNDTDMEFRTARELVDRLIIFDRAVAFIPAQDDRKVALELRHPGLVDYLVKVFDQQWRNADPLFREQPRETSVDGVPEIQRTIARLLVEGQVDEAIARRLGMNVRTCRAHIAKLAAALGSGSRAQLGYLIARSGLLDDESAPEGQD